MDVLIVNYTSETEDCWIRHDGRAEGRRGRASAEMDKTVMQCKWRGDSEMHAMVAICVVATWSDKVQQRNDFFSSGNNSWVRGVSTCSYRVS